MDGWMSRGGDAGTEGGVFGPNTLGRITHNRTNHAVRCCGRVLCWLSSQIPADLIALEPASVARIDRAAPEVLAKERAEKEAERAAAAEPERVKNKARGRSKADRRKAKREANIVNTQRALMREKQERELKERRRERLERDAHGGAAGGGGARDAEPKRSALSRFLS